MQILIDVVTWRTARAFLGGVMLMSFLAGAPKLADCMKKGECTSINKNSPKEDLKSTVRMQDKSIKLYAVK